MQHYNFSDLPAHGFATTPTANGHTWSLASVFGGLIEEAEARYGVRDRNYTLLGVEFGAETPRIWFPRSSDKIIVQLTDNARLDPNRATFQMAHEIIHLLAPIMAPANALVVEEGLAVVFSDEIGGLQRQKWHTSPGTNYSRAGEAVASLLSHGPAIVKQIRAVEPSFSNWTADLLAKTVPSIDPFLAKRLCAPFVY